MLTGTGFACLGIAQAQTPPEFVFDRTQAVDQWRAQHDLEPPSFVHGAMRLRITGADPYLSGPVRDYPRNTPLLLQMRIRSERGGMAQVFYCAEEQGPSEARSVRFGVPAGKWFEASVRVPPLGPRSWLRIDPPGSQGICDVAWLKLSAATVVAAPAWPKPIAAQVGASPFVLRSGGVELFHGRGQFGALKLFVNGRLMACGNTAPLIGYEHGGASRWLRNGRSEVRMQAGAIVSSLNLADPEGTTWTITQRFVMGSKPGSLDVAVTVAVDRPRNVFYLPLLILHPGLGSFGARHGQAVFPGLEYLDNGEESSSEKDLVGVQSQRLAPDSAKITIPLMALQQEGRYLALSWEPNAWTAALFDVPDRQFKSGAHLMGLAFPGSDGTNRREGSLVADLGTMIRPGEPLTLRATLFGGLGESCVPALQSNVERRGLPTAPKPPYGLESYVRLAAGGWLDSAVSAGDGQYRHAYWPGVSGFNPGPAADVASFLVWLAAYPGDPALSKRLDDAAGRALSRVKPGGLDQSGVSHVRYPVQSLLFGGSLECALKAHEAALAELSRFEPDGRVLYRVQSGKPDYGRTHFAPDANGLTAGVVLAVLTAALHSGDPDLVKQAIGKLRALDRFTNTVPRGAQTWEVPLHTPDILASAHLVRCYTIGYELTGEVPMLEKARYWAYTGLPFVYLRQPTEGPVGLYATIPVFGATNWEAPNWLGLPVQWCGLVYSDALYWLTRHDPKGPWRRIADGITISGMQQTFPLDAGDLRGLLPDAFGLRAQTRIPVAINPGTLQASAIRLLHGLSLYDYRVLRASGAIVHAPGEITIEASSATRASFRVDTWRKGPYDLLVVGLKTRPSVSVDGQAVDVSGTERWHPAGRLSLRVVGNVRVTLNL